MLGGKALPSRHSGSRVSRGRWMPKSAASTRSTSAPSISSRSSRVPSFAVTTSVRPVRDRWASGVVRWTWRRTQRGAEAARCVGKGEHPSEHGVAPAAMSHLPLSSAKVVAARASAWIGGTKSIGRFAARRTTSGWGRARTTSRYWCCKRWRRTPVSGGPERRPGRTRPDTGGRTQSGCGGEPRSGTLRR